MNRNQSTVKCKSVPAHEVTGRLDFPLARPHPDNISIRPFMSCSSPFHTSSFVVSLAGGDRLDLVISDSATLTYDDLLGFSYQVAKGMEFLASKNVRCGDQRVPLIPLQHNRPFRNKSVANSSGCPEKLKKTAKQNRKLNVKC